MSHGGGTLSHGGGTLTHGGGTLSHGGGTLTHGGGTLSHGGGTLTHGGGTLSHGGGTLSHGGGTLTHGGGTLTHAQLSCSALERLGARRSVPLHRRSPVCRNLFGPVDHDELKREMSDRMREVSERDRQRWNFDFESDSPLDGPYRWERVSADSSPSFYRDSGTGGRTRTGPVTVRPSLDSSVPEVRERLTVPGSSGASCPVELNQENRTDALNAGSRAHSRCVRRKRTVSGESRGLITDFFKRRKSADRKGSDISACHLSKSAIPVEQTPRRGIR